jgi:hypothetical protein
MHESSPLTVSAEDACPASVGRGWATPHAKAAYPMVRHSAPYAAEAYARNADAVARYKPMDWKLSTLSGLSAKLTSPPESCHSAWK